MAYPGNLCRRSDGHISVMSAVVTIRPDLYGGTRWQVARLEQKLIFKLNNFGLELERVLVKVCN